MNNKKIKHKITEIDTQILKLNPTVEDDRTEMNELLAARKGLLESLQSTGVNPNVLLEVGGKILISGIVLAIEKNGILTTKVPITSFISFKK
jgi:hypothetical protein